MTGVIEDARDAARWRRRAAAAWAAAVAVVGGGLAALGVLGHHIWLQATVAAILATAGVVPVAAATVTGGLPMWLAVTGAVVLLPASVAAVGHAAHPPRLRLRVDGRPRAVHLATANYAMPAEELAELIDRYRHEPPQRHALGGPER